MYELKRAVIIDYQETWPLAAANEIAKINDALGPLASRIDHIGSTSVPGLAAKNIIDLQMTLPNFENIGQMVQPLANLGFEYWGDYGDDHLPPWASGNSGGWEKRYFSRRESPRAHLHIRLAGRPNQEYPLLFRDYLRNHRDAALAYATFKRKLASITTMDDYTDVKDAFCDIVMVAAREWAIRTGWTQRSDDAK